ncbi:MAG: Azurin [Verrucomicrobiaceae bacterium]|jgi:azurin|nr:azurin [Verrucomicrobiales bacterium]NCF87483.1 Azurin [Verrucomicrobiaceae bacterium]MDB2347394.1 azurin [Verrucomicrobiales bacterium]MDB4468055.1 azurin [Verrucomicrobiales bacterium]MDC0503290.1 azurin [Verrucomicrobiales bacterium]
MKRPIQLITCLSVAFALKAATANEPEKGVNAIEKPAAESKEKEEAADIEVTITGNDTMQYDKKAFTIETGEKVKLTFKNVGKLPKAAMGHNVVILKKGTNKVAYATAAITAGPAADYMPAANKKDVLVATKMLGPGEEVSVVFTAPAPGLYDYICTFPGHYALMNGVMTVK